MKLSKDQVRVLAKKIANEINEENEKIVKKHNDPIINSKKYIEFETINKDVLKLKELYEKFEIIPDYTLRSAISIIKKKSFDLKELDRVYHTSLEDEIVLMTIDSPDMETVIKKLTEKYIKK